MNRPRFIAALGLAAVFIPGAAVNATKPCEASPCMTSSGAFDRKACEEAAAWVAVGKIAKVVHHPAGYPLLKDFAQFTFTVERWDKSDGKTSRELRFKVGWCDNQQSLQATNRATHTRFACSVLPLHPRENLAISTSSASRNSGGSRS